MYRKRSGKKLLLALVGLLVVGCAVALALKPSSKPAATNQPPTVDQKAEAQQQEDNAKVNRIEHPQTNNTASDQVIISEVGQEDETQQVVVKTKLVGSGWSSCQVTFTKGSSAFSREAGVIFQPEYSSCLGFAVDASTFPSAGQWSVSLTAKKSDGSSQTSASRVITVTK